MKTTALTTLAVIAATAGAQTVSYTGGGGPIIDWEVTSRTITVTDTFAIEDLDLTITGFRHNWIGDIAVELEHNGVSVTLFDRPGYPDHALGFLYDVDGDYTFDDEALVSWELVNGGSNSTSFVIPVGSYAGEEALSAFDGMSVAGEWTLRVTDFASFEQGSFSGWTLDVTAVPTPSGLAALGLAGLAASRRRRG